MGIGLDTIRKRLIPCENTYISIEAKRICAKAFHSLFNPYEMKCER